MIKYLRSRINDFNAMIMGTDNVVIIGFWLMVCIPVFMLTTVV